MKKLLLSALAVSVMFVSCKKDDNNNPVKPEQEKDLSGVFMEISDIHKNMDKKSSEELIKTFNKFKSDVASDARADIANWINNVKPAGDAAKGKAGKLGKRYLTAKGIENGQLIKKGLIGAFQLHQALEYGQKLMGGNLTKEQQESILKGFSTALLGDYASIDNKKEMIKDKHGDFMGYPAKEGNEFAKYVNVVNNNEHFEGISDELYNALKDAKKSLGNQQAVTGNIMKALAVAQKIVAIRGVHYLKDGGKLEGEALSDDVAHGISEGLGFYYSLQFTYNPKSNPRGSYISREEVMGTLENLDLWNGEASKETLESLAKNIAEKFDFNWTEA